MLEGIIIGFFIGVTLWISVDTLNKHTGTSKDEEIFYLRRKLSDYKYQIEGLKEKLDTLSLDKAIQICKEHGLTITKTY